MQVYVVLLHEGELKAASLRGYIVQYINARTVYLGAVVYPAAA